MKYLRRPFAPPFPALSSLKRSTDFTCGLWLLLRGVRLRRVSGPQMFYTSWLTTLVVCLGTIASGQGTKVIVSDDKQTLTITYGTIRSQTIKVQDLQHQPSIVAPDFKLEAKAFRDAKLSPKHGLVAFTVTGYTHDWIGLFTADTGKSKDVDILFDGIVGALSWSPDGSYIAVDSTPASGLRTIRVIDTSRAKLVGSISHIVSQDKEVETYSPMWEGGRTIVFKQKEPDGIEKTGRYTLQP